MGKGAFRSVRRRVLEKYEVLKKYFGYTSFKEGQEELVDSILTGRDVLGIMPTGAGKSAECVILYSSQDVHINKYLIKNRGENSELIEEQQELFKQLKALRLRIAKAVSLPPLKFYVILKNVFRKYFVRIHGN